MKKLVLFALIWGALTVGAQASTLSWDAVTTDVGGNAETIALYRCYSRQFGTTNAFVKFGETATLSIATPTSSAKQEYVVTAVDAAGNESAFSTAVTLKPNAPGNPKVN